MPPSSPEPRGESAYVLAETAGAKREPASRSPRAGRTAWGRRRPRSCAAGRTRGHLGSGEKWSDERAPREDHRRAPSRDSTVDSTCSSTTPASASARPPPSTRPSTSTCSSRSTFARSSSSIARAAELLAHRWRVSTARCSSSTSRRWLGKSGPAVAVGVLGATKAAVISYTQSMNKELIAQSGVKSVALVPRIRRHGHGRVREGRDRR